VNRQKQQHPQPATKLENLPRAQETLSAEEAESTHGGRFQVWGNTSCIGVAYGEGDFAADATDVYYALTMIPG
jgi:hypothetical protein